MRKWLLGDQHVINAWKMVTTIVCSVLHSQSLIDFRVTGIYFFLSPWIVFWAESLSWKEGTWCSLQELSSSSPRRGYHHAATGSKQERTTHFWSKVATTQQVSGYACFPHPAPTWIPPGSHMHIYHGAAADSPLCTRTDSYIKRGRTGLLCSARQNTILCQNLQWTISTTLEADLTV